MAGSGDEILKTIDDGGIATITINRPRKRNAVTLAMWQVLGDIFTDLAADAAVRCIVLTGAGEHFCAGADISEFSEVRSTVEAGQHYDEIGDRAMLAIQDCPKPTIAAVRGFGVGGGCGLSLACDLRVGDLTTLMGIPAARLGIVYGPTDCELLIRQVGLAKAKLVLFSGKYFPADEALRLGLLDILLDDALAGAEDLARVFAANAPLSLAGAKLILQNLAAGTTDENAERIQTEIDQALLSEDAKEGATAFGEKRQPVFKGY